MGRLIIVAGAGGAGKSFFLRKWAEHDNKAERIKKFVSEKRAPREIEIRTGESDLIFSRCYDPTTRDGANWYISKYGKIEVSNKLEYHDKIYNFNSLDSVAVYDYHGSYYEVDINKINEALSNDKNPIVIVRKCETIKKLIEIYSNALIIYVQSILSGQDLVNKLVELGESEDDARKREGRNAEDLNDYISSIHQLPSNIRVVVNDYNEDTSGAVYTQIRDIYDEEIRNYKFKERSVFIIQSYENGESCKDKFDIIQSAVTEILGYPYENFVYQGNMRQNGAYMIPNHVWSSIDSSDFIICDITNDRCNSCKEFTKKDGEYVLCKNFQGTSPNVWLELGYAISFLRKRGIDVEKRLLIISESSETKKSITPVDLGGTGLNIVYYTNYADLLRKLKLSLKSMFLHNL